MKSGLASSIHLAEEQIPCSNSDGFVKYIHNGSAIPRTFQNAATNDIAQFLAFTQHVQYAKTDRQVYISDYQGM
ncbi:hypothetical protein JVT61DRAFT_11042 [Boletus reticuloceps]|uniref:Alpha-type protein kinase domain-containing protein n=1 Tax=Boletus reticuloceps TaxID=495285 RepID=A0A8I2YF98_9AGAM|nr:hypothetical protein JVT61DRAFT_11042 [Boletus reticuloceps]